MTFSLWREEYEDCILALHCRFSHPTSPGQKQTDFFSKDIKIVIDVHFHYFNSINTTINILSSLTEFFCLYNKMVNENNWDLGEQ